MLTVNIAPMHTTFIAALALAASTASAQPLKYPDAPKKPVTDTYFDTKVVEDYRWLENGSDPQVRDWSLKQLAVTRAYLDALPQRARLKERLAELLNNSRLRYVEFQQTSGGFFALKIQPPKNQPMLVVMKSAGDVASERVLLDPNAVNAKATTAIDFYKA